ncbi:MAG: aldose epimerase [Janthinobacterium lividum]
MPENTYPIVTVGDDAASLIVAPSAGGRLMRWIVDGHDILAWPQQPDWSDVAKIRGGDPLLFPFIGRHRVDGNDGFWRDAQGVVRAMPTHGFARRAAFDFRVDDDGQGIVMRLRDNPATQAAYPFAFEFEVRYRLVEGGSLDAEFIVRNRAAAGAALPYYAGHHFYFALPHRARADSTLRLPPTDACRQQPNGMPGNPEPAALHYRLNDPALQDTFHVLRATTASPQVTIEMPTLGRTLLLDLARPGSVPWYAVTTWSEREDSDFYCVEPWLGLPDAIHHKQGLRWLEPGQQERAICRLSVRLGHAN